MGGFQLSYYCVRIGVVNVKIWYLSRNFDLTFPINNFVIHPMTSFDRFQYDYRQS